MNYRTVLFYTSLLLWAGGLVLTCLQESGLAVLCGLLAVCMLSIFILQDSEVKMFRNRAKSVVSDNVSVKLPASVPLTGTGIDSTDTSVRCESGGNTLIAAGAHFTGNIRAQGLVQVCGVVTGNVDARDGSVSVMRDGVIEGDVNCLHMLVNGCVTGRCEAEHVDVGEHGIIRGSLFYRTLSVSPGGCLSGETDRLSSEDKASTDERQIQGSSYLVDSVISGGLQESGESLTDKTSGNDI